MTSPGLSNQPNLLLISLSCDLSSSLCHWTMAWRQPWTMVAWWPLPFLPRFFFLLMLFLPSLGELICSCVFSYCQYGDDSSLTQTSFPDTRPIFLNVWSGHLYFVFLCHLQVTRPQVQLTLFLSSSSFLYSFLMNDPIHLTVWEKILCHPRLLLLYHPSSQIILHLLPLDYKLFFLLLLSWYNVLAFLIWP